MGNFSKRLQWLNGLVSIYTTPRVVKIDSKFLAITYLILMVMVWIAFLRSYQLDLRRIYQKSCTAKGVSLLKIKGIITTESYTDEELAIKNPHLYKRVWDNEDLIKSGGGESFFVTTNVVITPNQTRGYCAQKKHGLNCTNDEDCKELFNRPNQALSGIYDGICDTKEKKCMASAWCPIESDILPLNGTIALLKATKNFTVLIKNTVEFPECEDDESRNKGEPPKYKGRNIPKTFSNAYLKKCRYDPQNDPYCPIFRLGNIVKWAGLNYNNISIKGGVVRIRVNWDCEFDWGLTMEDCLPKYTFSNMIVDGVDTSPGYNFRTGSYHDENRRTLTKRYGLKFIVETAGEARKFDFLILVLTIGASIGLFALAPLVCDFLFDVFCLLKSLGGPCQKWFSGYTEEIRYQGVNAHLKIEKNKGDDEANENGHNQIYASSVANITPSHTDNTVPTTIESVESYPMKQMQ